MTLTGMKSAAYVIPRRAKPDVGIRIFSTVQIKMDATAA